MKKLTSFILVALFSATSFVAKADDAAGIALWSFPLQWGFPWDVENLTHPQAQAVASMAPGNFDAQNSDFDAVWTSISTEYFIANAVTNAESAKGATDFTGSFKVMYDNGNIYVLLKYTDEDVTGNETTEIMWSQDLKIDAIPLVFSTEKVASQYVRYFEFGGTKASFSNTGFSSAFTVEGSKESVSSQLNFAANPPVYVNNLFVNDHTTLGTPNERKLVYTIGFPALTGELRPNFDISIWSALNSNKGISFDVKVNDIDGDDVMSTDAVPVALPAGYWWNSTNNAGWDLTSYSGFLATDVQAGVKEITSKPAIFGKITNELVLLNEKANVKIFSATGKQMMQIANTDQIDLGSLAKGVYVINANNQIMKVVR